MILYIHGFGSCGEGGKASLFRGYFASQGIPFIAPSLSYVPALAMATLEELIASYDEVTLIGSSLGGYYTLYLAEKYGLKAVLINPAVASAKTLKRAVDLEGKAKNYYDDSYFEWNHGHLEMLASFETTHNSATYLLLLQKGDDVLDYQDALDKLPHARLILEEEGSHSFDGIVRYFEMIREFAS